MEDRGKASMAKDITEVTEDRVDLMARVVLMEDKVALTEGRVVSMEDRDSTAARGVLTEDKEDSTAVREDRVGSEATTKAISTPIQLLSLSKT